MPDKYTPQEVTRALIYSEMMVQTLTPNQQMKLLAVLMAKIVVDGDKVALTHCMDKVRRETR